jgi:glycosyltransferase involved in cell wall biosynthesis
MKIAVLAHIRHAVAEPFEGGMESHCAGLCHGLREAGHAVTLFAAAGSCDPVLEQICPAPYDAVLPWERYRGTSELADYQRDAFGKAWRTVREGGFDVVHNNSLFPDIIGWAAQDGVPCLTSQHVPPFGPMRDAVEAAATSPHCRFTVASGSQLGLWDVERCPHMTVVPNGVDTGYWRPADARTRTFVWTGRITPNKGLAKAVEAASLAGIALEIYGPLEDAGYFDRFVAPFLSDRIVYRGHVERAVLRDRIAPAAGAILTPMWDEPFGLAAAEALSCGVPVVAFDRGAMREVIGPCGILVPAGEVEALAAAIQDLEGIDRAACRRRAELRLSRRAMISGYESFYEAAIAAGDATAPNLAAARSSSQSRTSALLA